MIVVAADDLCTRAGRVGVVAGLEDEGPPADGMLLVDGPPEGWSALAGLPGDSDPGFIVALARFPAVTIARVRGVCVGFAGSVVDAIDLPMAVGAPADDKALWAVEGSEDELAAWLHNVGKAIGRAPVAAASAALLVRSTSDLDVTPALVSESSVFAMLQTGDEFRTWLRTNRA